ncbi:DUF3324 domain-containing protein [Schleiferilactobacillus harbinensis]|uniref:DUF3324 domain-containing protein n=1 Tax=Schleiferilactobacillus harbinensis TaxID=304207 RepID=UPI00221E4975|nr:DUF3324 domain-containing protein [Schleiferilactobacillus harbinensis]
MSNKHPAILARIQNRAPQLFRGMTINAKITKQGETKTIYQYKLKDGSMAPNSNFDAPILGDEKGIPAGDYTLTMTVQAEGKTWRFKRNFTVTDKEAAKLAGANNAGNRQPPWQKWLIWAAIALAVLIAGYGLYLLGVRRGIKMTRRMRTIIKASLILSCGLMLGQVLSPDQARTADSTAQFTVVDDRTVPPKGDETLPESGIKPGGDKDTGHIPQLNEQTSPWLVIIGVELVILTGMGSWHLRKRGRQQ